MARASISFRQELERDPGARRVGVGEGDAGGELGAIVRFLRHGVQHRREVGFVALPSMRGDGGG